MMCIAAVAYKNYIFLAVSIAAFAVLSATLRLSAAAALFSPELHEAIKPATAKITNTFFILVDLNFLSYAKVIKFMENEKFMQFFIFS